MPPFKSPVYPGFINCAEFVYSRASKLRPHSLNIRRIGWKDKFWTGPDSQNWRLTVAGLNKDQKLLLGIGHAAAPRPRAACLHINWKAQKGLITRARRRDGNALETHPRHFLTLLEAKSIHARIIPAAPRFFRRRRKPPRQHMIDFLARFGFLDNALQIRRSAAQRQGALRHHQRAEKTSAENRPLMLSCNSHSSSLLGPF